MKNDELITDLVLSKKLTSFQEMTGLCDYHKLIVNNDTLILFKCHMRYGILHRTTKTSGFSCLQYKPIFFAITTPRKMIKFSLVRGILQLVFYPSLRESPIKKYATDIQYAQTMTYLLNIWPYISHLNAKIKRPVFQKNSTR